MSFYFILGYRSDRNQPSGLSEREKEELVSLLNANQDVGIEADRKSERELLQYLRNLHATKKAAQKKKSKRTFDSANASSEVAFLLHDQELVAILKDLPEDVQKEAAALDRVEASAFVNQYLNEILAKLKPIDQAVIKQQGSNMEKFAKLKEYMEKKREKGGFFGIW